jgi:broad specificity phosphatase PhoE
MGETMTESIPGLPARVPAHPPIYFVRHGETDWNRAGRLQGQMDITINDLGRTQARRNGERLADLLASVGAMPFIASPMLRTRQTMEIVRAACGLAPTDYLQEERLKEISFGEWEGRSWDDLKRTDPTRMKARKADRFNFVAPGGESYAMLSKRALGWLASIRAPCVVVSHGGVMRCLQGHALGSAPVEVPHLPVPQDRILRLEPDRIDWL